MLDPANSGRAETTAYVVAAGKSKVPKKGLSDRLIKPKIRHCQAGRLFRRFFSA